MLRFLALRYKLKNVTYRKELQHLDGWLKKNSNEKISKKFQQKDTKQFKRFIETDFEMTTT
jgi:hypothetical protein